MPIDRDNVAGEPLILDTNPSQPGCSGSLQILLPEPEQTLASGRPFGSHDASPTVLSAIPPMMGFTEATPCPERAWEASPYL